MSPIHEARRAEAAAATPPSLSGVQDVLTRREALILRSAPLRTVPFSCISSFWICCASHDTCCSSGEGAILVVLERFWSLVLAHPVLVESMHP